MGFYSSWDSSLRRCWNEPSLRKRRHLLLHRIFEVPLASNTMVDDCFYRLKTSKNPHKASQLAQDVFWACVKILMMDVANQRSDVWIFRRENHRVFLIMTNVRVH